MYDLGEGITQDSTEAVKWYRQSAEQGYALAQYALGVIYEKGEGATNDYKQAVQWYRQAAKQGYAMPLCQVKSHRPPEVIT